MMRIDIGGEQLDCSSEDGQVRPGRSVLAFSPRDYARAGGTHLPRLGEQTRREVRRWYDYLQAAARDPRPH